MRLWYLGLLGQLHSQDDRCGVQTLHGGKALLNDLLIMELISFCCDFLQPERIDPTGSPDKYDVRSDVWSLGISLVEVATGKFPYSPWKTPFDQVNKEKSKSVQRKATDFCISTIQQVKQVVVGEPPRLPAGRFSTDFEDFVSQWYEK